MHLPTTDKMVSNLIQQQQQKKKWLEQHLDKYKLITYLKNNRKHRERNKIAIQANALSILEKHH